MVTNEIEFLDVLMKCKDNENNCTYSKIAELSGLDSLEVNDYIKILKSKNMITPLDLETIHINSAAISNYATPITRALRSFVDKAVPLLKFLVTYILGIISGLIVAYLTNKLGWQQP